MKRFLLILFSILALAAQSRAATVLTLTTPTNTNCVVGLGFNVTISESGGAGWTPGSWILGASGAGASTPFSLSGGTGAFIDLITVNGAGTSANIHFYTGSKAGIITLTDTTDSVAATQVVSATYAAPTSGGTQYYLQGSTVRPPQYVFAAAVSPGAVVIQYLIQAGNATGLEPAYTASMEVDSGETYPITGVGCTSIANGPSSISGISSITLNWQPEPGATRYIIWRRISATLTGTWFNIGYVVATAPNTATTFSDTIASGSGSSGTPVTTDASSTGSDSNNGLTTGTAFATLAHAEAVATTSGQTIHVLGSTGSPDYVYETLQDVLSPGVNLVGPGRDAGFILNNFVSSNNSCNFVPGSNSQITDLTFDSSPAGDVAASGTNRGFGVGLTDTAATTFLAARCRFISPCSCIWITLTSGIDFYDCINAANHGAAGGVNTPTSQFVSINSVRCTLSSPGVASYPPVTGQLANVGSVGGGYVFRDPVLTFMPSGSDPPLSGKKGPAVNGFFASAGHPSAVTIINGKINTPYIDISTDASCGVTLINTQASPLAAITNTPQILNALSYQADPQITASASTAGSITGSVGGGIQPIP